MLLLRERQEAPLEPPPQTSEAVASPEKAAAALLLLRQGKISANEILKSANPVIERLSRWAARRYGIESQADDVAQELRIALVTRIVKQWDGKRPLSSLLAGWAWRIASGINEDNEGFRNVSFEEMYESSEADLWDSFSVEEGELSDGIHLMNPVDVLVASEESMQAAKAVEAGPMPTAQQLAAALAEAEGRPLNAGQPARRAQKPTLSVEERKRKKKEAAEKIDQRLFDARASLGMSRRELAAAIGMEFSRYAAYESGKRASVPGEVYESVELLLENSATSVRRANEIKGMSMSEVVQLWQKILGGCSVAELQDAICVSPRTMRRWRLDLYTPRHNIVVSYHSKVYEIAGMRKVKNNVKSIDS